MTRIVIIDDDELTRAVLRESVERADDLELVGEAATAIDGIALARGQKPDVVVLDHHLPGEPNQRQPMQGIESIKYLRTIVPRPRVVLFTMSPNLEAQARAAGADEVVLKTGTPALLLATIRRLTEST